MKLTHSLLLAAGLSLAAFQANAATTIQVDFGGAANTGTGLSRNIGSYGAAKADGYTVANFWNVTSASANSLVNDAGTATTVNLTLASEAPLGSPQAAALATVADAGNDAITKDYVYTTNGTTTATFANLAADTYDIYVMIGNTNNATALARTFNVGFTVGGSLLDTLAIGPLSGGGDNTIWEAGTNYVKYRATIGTGESLAITSTGTNAGTKYGVFNGIQIVAVPEPSSALLGALGALGLCFRRARKSA